MGKWEVIVEFGDSEERVSILGKALEDCRWKFLLKTQGNNPGDILNEEDAGFITSKNEPIGDWTQAVVLMNRYPWKRMYPIKIHPLFKAFLWDRINYDKDYDDCSVRWYTKCFIPEEEDFGYKKAYAIHE